MPYQYLVAMYAYEENPNQYSYSRIVFCFRNCGLSLTGLMRVNCWAVPRLFLWSLRGRSHG